MLLACRRVKPEPTEHLDSIVPRRLPIREIEAAVGLRQSRASLAISNLLDSEDPKTAHVAAVAARWLELAAEGDPSPSTTLAAERAVTSTTIARWINEAREKGLLPQNTKRKSGARSSQNTER